MNPEEFLRARFQEYYKNNIVAQPPSPEKREFGFGTFGRKIADRHLSFESHDAMNKFLREEVPFYFSYSAAYYKKPAGRPMQAKEFLGGDLIYEFDADDLKTECKQRHDSWVCKCGAKGKGNPAHCTECGSAVRVKQWVCDECLSAVKAQAFSLLKVLQDDFGFSEGISVNFSGHKGYHLHVRAEAVRELTPSARIELVDYITGNGIDLASAGFYMEDKKMRCPVPEDASGWGKKLVDALLELFRRGDWQEIAVAGNLPAGTLAKGLAERKDEIIAGINNGTLHQLPGRKTEKFWHSALEYCTEKTRLDIDRQTSVDVAKIVRVPDTIHGGTGLLANSIGIGELHNFRPLRDAVIFGDSTVKVKTDSLPKFTIGGREFGPLEKGGHELPGFAAIYLLARGDASGNGL